MKKSARQRGGDLRSKPQKPGVANAVQIPFQGIAHVGRGSNRVSFKAGLLAGKRVGSASVGAKIVF